MLPDSDGGRVLRVAMAPAAPILMAGTEALLRAADPDIVMVDLPPHGQGLAVIDVVLYDPLDGAPEGFAPQATGPRPTLIAFSWSLRGDTVTTARSQGALGILSKGLAAQPLATAIRSIHAGEHARFAVVSETDEVVGQRSQRPHGLTQRELDMLELITEGRSNEEIAKSLYLSINSVKTYIRMAYRKIGVTRRSQAVLWGVHHGLADAQTPRAHVAEPAPDR